MASQLFRASLRAIARPNAIKAVITPKVTSRVVPAFQATRSFSTTFVRMGTGAGKNEFCLLFPSSYSKHS
ncbi:hypothetical protein G6F68_020600 [Rhizopus microsporus]|nr:hypothetical protein G6F68_020600 [Rhizopus microsporus]